jgi:hypothetical protein
MVSDRELYIDHTVYQHDYETLAHKYGLSEDSIRGRISRTGENIDVVTEAMELMRHYAPKNTGDRLRQNHIIEFATATWEKALSDWRRFGETVTIGWLSDIHFPFQYKPALNLAYQIMEAAQPQIITAFNDLFDFDQYGRWAKTPNAATYLWQSDIRNAIRLSEVHNKTLDRLVPGVLKPALMANHDKRIFSYLRSNQNGFSEHNVTAFMAAMEDQGVLQFSNSGMHENVIQVSPGLKLVHGVSSAANASTVGAMTIKKLGGTRLTEDAGIFYNTAAGHTHRSFEVTSNGVTHWNFGCLCTMTPGYLAHTPDWQPGCGILEFDPNGRTVFGTRIDFYRRGDRLCARYKDTEFTTGL